MRGSAALADAVARRAGQRPQIVEAGGEPPAGRRIVVGSQTAPELASAKPEISRGDHLPAVRNGQRTAIAGCCRRQPPPATLMACIAWPTNCSQGADEASLFGQQRTFEPAMRRRLVDLGGVGIPQDPDRWDPTNYPHHCTRSRMSFSLKRPTSTR